MRIQLFTRAAIQESMTAFNLQSRSIFHLQSISAYGSSFPIIRSPPKAGSIVIIVLPPTRGRHLESRCCLIFKLIVLPKDYISKGSLPTYFPIDNNDEVRLWISANRGIDPHAKLPKEFSIRFLNVILLEVWVTDKNTDVCKQNFTGFSACKPYMPILDRLAQDESLLLSICNIERTITLQWAVSGGPSPSLAAKQADLRIQDPDVQNDQPNNQKACWAFHHIARSCPSPWCQSSCLSDTVKYEVFRCIPSEVCWGMT